MVRRYIDCSDPDDKFNIGSSAPRILGIRRSATRSLDGSNIQTDAIGHSVFGFFSDETVKLNSFMQKKTGAQSLVNVALISSNAAQLNQALTRGTDNSIHTAVISLIIVSVVLQALQLISMLIIGALFDLNYKKNHTAQVCMNYISLGLSGICMMVNLTLAVLDGKDT